MKEKKYYGKEKCRILKQIRAEIAKQNDIAWVVEECSHKGNCRGTCPKCEAEVRQLEKALERRAALGKTVAVVGISAGLSLSVIGCENPFAVQGNMQIDGALMPPETSDHTDSTQVEFDGVEIPYTDTVAVTEEFLMGDPVVEGEMIPIPGEEPETEVCTMDVDVPMGDMVEIPDVELGGAPPEYDYMDRVLSITVAETLPSCVAIEDDCFYGTDKDGYFWRIYCADTSAIEEGKTYEIEIGDPTWLTYPDGYPSGWTPQYEATVLKIIED
ncbi:MAG: hypothetical protein E7645_09315 [Ruminococcaceae bacterium]|nr:hypothetical protein [Oscillospiraceae bacterium]